ncbi:MAG: hypothetical protein CL905_01735 [Dehalococcoidia bacterium]|jgi:glycerol-3-phosphate acyltransferase PlsX|nr:hypothetical protein [Dehalococcoidia bacterium]
MNQKEVTIALDGMGGDFAPYNNIKGALIASKQSNVNILLVGDPNILKREIENQKIDSQKIKIIPSSGVVEEGEPPGMAFKNKPEASVFVCAGLVKKGLADGFVSCGASGGTFASAAFAFGMFEGLSKPAGGGAVNGFAPKTLILDLALNVDCSPKQLFDFAALGVTQAKILYDIENPTVAILSNGSEKGKGNKSTKETSELLESSNMNFVGNIEGDDISEGKANVVVCDGFTGNILLKSIEGLGKIITEFISKESKSDQLKDISNEIFRLTHIMQEFGGGPIFGVNGIAIVGHGKSNAQAISNGIGTAAMLARKNYIQESKKQLSELRSSIKSNKL